MLRVQELVTVQIPTGIKFACEVRKVSLARVNELLIVPDQGEILPRYCLGTWPWAVWTMLSTYPRSASLGGGVTLLGVQDNDPVVLHDDLELGIHCRVDSWIWDQK